MCKVEERAYKAYPYNGDYRGQGDSNSKFREAYINGYHQAEEDLELGWKDINNIKLIIEQVECDYVEIDKKLYTKDFYQEVLKRFKERKEK